MQVKVEIKTTLSFHHKDVDPIEGASPEQVLQTARMQGAEIHMKVEPQRTPNAPKKAAQGVKKVEQPVTGPDLPVEGTQGLTERELYPERFE